MHDRSLTRRIVQAGIEKQILKVGGCDYASEASFEAEACDQSRSPGAGRCRIDILARWRRRGIDTAGCGHSAKTEFLADPGRPARRRGNRRRLSFDVPPVRQGARRHSRCNADRMGPLWRLPRMPWLSWMPLRRLRRLRGLLCVGRLLPPLLSGTSWLHVSGEDLIGRARSSTRPILVFACPGGLVRGGQFPVKSKDANALTGVSAPDEAAMRSSRKTGIRVLIR